LVALLGIDIMLGKIKGFVIIFISIIVGVIVYSQVNPTRDQRSVENYTREISPRGDLADFEKTTISIFNSAAPSVVYIFTENAVSDIFGRRELRQGAGSGFLWDQEGHIVTNFHVIEGARRIQVRLDNGENKC
jgi:2-alkenal reductase